MSKQHTFNLSPYENGAESLILTTNFELNGDPVTTKQGIYVTHELTLHSYGNSATFRLCGIELTPELLRELANELEIERNKLIVECQVNR